jgi:hypothetical protein
MVVKYIQGDTACEETAFGHRRAGSCETTKARMVAGSQHDVIWSMVIQRTDTYPESIVLLRTKHEIQMVMI